MSIGGKKCSKNTITVLRNTSMTLWQVRNCGFTRMSPKVDSSPLHKCFKMSQIQQKLLVHKALPSKWSSVLRKNWTCYVNFVLYMSDGTNRLKSTPSDRFLRNFTCQMNLVSECWKEVAKELFCHISFNWRCLTWNLSRGFHV